ncbi:hypothetical protein GH714_030181 [Hevea brasiliensis]|uniref:Uncharacterized protein n=1 Tax=Hevea brasiliensis TaxID=3981 RepID=A0A6A6KEC2_HEVBR|nr:hypothetical protein GH714_030181 [Hevea brasiliensis]
MKFIPSCYHKDTYLMSYQFSIQLVRGKSFWKCEDYETIEPLEFKRQPGRLRKKRIMNKMNLRRYFVYGNSLINTIAIPTEQSSQPFKVEGKSLRDQTTQTNDPPTLAQPPSAVTFHNRIQKLPVTRPNNVASKLSESQSTLNSSGVVIDRGDTSSSYVQSNSNVGRKIGIISMDNIGNPPLDLGFKAPGLKWAGRPCVTKRQLKKQREI